MYRDGWSSTHINTGLQLVTRISIEIFLMSLILRTRNDR